MPKLIVPRISQDRQKPCPAVRPQPKLPKIFQCLQERRLRQILGHLLSAGQRKCCPMDRVEVRHGDFFKVVAVATQY
jgi:hypothetical protein